MLKNEGEIHYLSGAGCVESHELPDKSMAFIGFVYIVKMATGNFKVAAKLNEFCSNIHVHSICFCS